MKKKLLFLFFLVIPFIFPNKSLAACTPLNGPAALCGTLYVCNVSLTKNYCCDTKAECDVLKSGAGGSFDLWCDYNSTTGTGTKLKTAIGCIPVLSTKEAFLSFVLKWAVGIGGGIAFLLIIYAGFMIMTSAGNPERLKAGQELLTSAISGLILLIFSIVILKIIGVDILGLNSFGFNQ